MRRLALPFTLIALLALPQAAGAAVRQIIRGAGFGHGIGMSQYGAYGYAQHGYSYQQILAHYYQGTNLSKAGSADVRVLLETGSRTATFSGATDGGGHKLNPSKTYKVKLNGLSGEILFDPKGKQLGHFDTPLDITSSTVPLRLGGRAMNGVNGGHYHGALEFRPSPFSGLAVVNVVSLDDYVQGVVPGEMPTSWAPAALQAQAVAARSYALATDAGGPVFDQYPDTRSQVYKGADAEVASSNAAVSATADQVLRYQGQVAATYFFSTSGGHTEDVQNVFYGAKPEPYLTGVSDPYDNISPKHRWTISTTTARLQRRLGSLVHGKLRGIKVLQRGVSPRIVWAGVVGSRGTTRVRGVTLRNELGLDDTWASFSRFSTKQKPGKPPTSTPTTPTTPGTPGGGVQAGSASMFSGKQVHLFPKAFHPGKPARLYGSLWPAHGHALALVQEKGRDGRWHRVGHTRLTKHGYYNVPVRGSGLFRITVGPLTGPPMQVR
ncbi:MAG TPA: SpoIID/LytB domain-containing protein [Thermoleophilaceae bacterium]|jgi:stage II sporulation protein D